MDIQLAIFDVRARLHTFNTRHNTHDLSIPDSLIEESIHLIHLMENIAQHRKETQARIHQYLQAWRPIFMKDTPPGDHRGYANAFVLTRNPLMLHEYDADGKATPLTSTADSPFLKSWLHRLPQVDASAPINTTIYQTNPDGLHNFHAFIRNHKTQKSVYLLKKTHASEPALPQACPLYEPLTTDEHACLGPKAIAIIIDHSLRILASAPYLDSQHFIHYFLGALSLSLQTYYKTHAIDISHNLICSALQTISMSAVVLSTHELAHYENLVLNTTQAARLAAQHIEQYPPACIKEAASLDRHMHREAADDDLVSGRHFQANYRRLRKKTQNFDQRSDEFKKVSQIADRIDLISLATDHTVEWRLHRQWQYIDQQLKEAAAERPLWQKVLGMKSLRQRCLQKLQNGLELVHPAVLQKKIKVVSNLQVIENSDYSGSTERSSFESTVSLTEKSSRETMAHHLNLTASGSNRSHKILSQDHHSTGFNHYFRDTHHRGFFHSPEKIYCEPQAEETLGTSPAAQHARHKNT